MAEDIFGWNYVEEDPVKESTPTSAANNDKNNKVGAAAGEKKKSGCCSSYMTVTGAYGPLDRYLERRKEYLATNDTERVARLDAEWEAEQEEKRQAMFTWPAKKCCSLCCPKIFFTWGSYPSLTSKIGKEAGDGIGNEFTTIKKPKKNQIADSSASTFPNISKSNYSNQAGQVQVSAPASGTATNYAGNDDKDRLQWGQYAQPSSTYAADMLESPGPPAAPSDKKKKKKKTKDGAVAESEATVGGPSEVSFAPSTDERSGTKKDKKKKKKKKDKDGGGVGSEASSAPTSTEDEGKKKKKKKHKKGKDGVAESESEVAGSTDTSWFIDEADGGKKKKKHKKKDD